MEELARVNLCVEEHGEAGDGSDSEEGSVWSGGSDSGGGSADEEVAASSCEGEGAPSDTESLDEDTSINSSGVDLQVEIQSLIAADPCEARCLRGKEVPLGNFICSVSQMTNAEQALSGIKQYQPFSMASDAPGTVSCRVGPDSTPLVQDIRRRFDGIFTDDTKVCVMFDEHLEPLSPLPVNSEKKQDIYNKVRPYVPEEFVNDPLYDAPNDTEEVEAKTVKRDRRTRSKAAKSKKPRGVEENNAEGTAQAVATACHDTEQNAEGVSCDVAAQAKQTDLPRKRARKASK